MNKKRIFYAWPPHLDCIVCWGGPRDETCSACSGVGLNAIPIQEVIKLKRESGSEFAWYYRDEK